MPWPCMLLRATGQASLVLRRSTTTTCAHHPLGYHNAFAFIGTAPITISPSGTWHAAGEMPPRDDPRWPEVCVCGYRFQDDDSWQLARHRIYTTESGEQITLSEARPGMLWDADWYLDFDDPWAGPDGRCLMCRLPDRTEWCIDGPSRTGGRWTREGEPPLLTVRPSIASSGYHGWLSDGVLSDDLEGRRYE